MDIDSYAAYIYVLVLDVSMESATVLFLTVIRYWMSHHQIWFLAYCIFFCSIEKYPIPVWCKYGEQPILLNYNSKLSKMWKSVKRKFIDVKSTLCVWGYSVMSLDASHITFTYLIGLDCVRHVVDVDVFACGWCDVT